MKNISSKYYWPQLIRRSELFLILAVFTAPFAFLNAQQMRAAFRFEPDFTRIQSALASAPPERDAAARPAVLPVIELPDPRGGGQSLQVRETSMLAPDFAAKYPDFKTYSLTDPVTGVYRGQLFSSRFGLQALIFSAEGTFMVHPLDRSNPTVHEAYFEENMQVNCSGDFHSDDFKKAERQTPEALMAPNGTIIRTYRLAIVTTGEYYQGNGNTVPLANAAVVTDVNNMSAIYKRELAVNFTLLTPVHYTNPATDPFVPDESNGVFLADQAAAVVGANFAQSAYDLGHALHHIPNYGQGWAGWGACNNYALPDPDGAGPVYTTGGHAKGLGWSAGASQSLWFARLIAHEVGHMFGAEHTFNGSGGSCTPPPFGQIATSASYEIGSGTTIMSYIGNCSSDQNIPSSWGTADYYFHSKNLEQILSYISSEGTCATTASSGNQPPTVSANPCGGGLTIPKLTPFTLTGSGSDPDGHTVYYNWEQIDEDGANVAPTQGYVGTTAGNSSIAPLFRSYPATTSPARTFPASSFILNNANVATFEALPNVARTLNFRLQARDNQTFGAINNSDVAVTVSGTTGPLTVTVPNGGENWASGNQTITWSVNGTNALSANVRIVMSLDGGQSFPIVLAASTPNDGSQTVSVPAVAASTTARVKVECVINNCLTFFDISNANFIFTSSCVALPTAICPTTAQTFPQGDPGLNLSFNVQKPAVVTSKTFTLSSGDPTMNRVRWNASETACEAPGGTPPNYQVFKFVVSESGPYLVSSGLGNYRAVHLFANSFNPNGGCANFVASSVVKDTFFSYLKTNPVLNACTEYYLVVTNQYGGNNTTITFSGPGSVLEVFTPVTNYSYTFAAVNTANDQIAAVSATAAFTALGPGNYQIYGLHYKSSGATPPANADPNAFVGQTIAQLLGAGICFNASSTSRPITVTATSPQLVINEADYHQPVSDDAEFIELKNISASAVNLSGWTLELVDGNAGGATVYQTITLPNVSVPAGGYYVVCGNSAKVPNCNLVVAPSTNLIQNGTPDAIGLRQNGALRDAVSYEGNAGAPYTESAGVSPGDTGVGVRHSIARFPDGTDTNNNSTNFTSNVCGTPGAANINSTLSIQSVSTAVSCNGGSNGSVALTVSGGIAPYTYLWSNGQTTATATNLAAGTYTATVTSTYGCAASVTASVTQPAALSIGKTITNVSCPGGSNGSVALSVTGGTTPYTYLWSNGQTTATATALVAGTYTTTVTDNKGCVVTTTSTVTQPAVLSIGKTITNVSCPSGNNGSVALSVTGGTTPYSYLWSNGQTTATATTLVAGTYTATVTDNKGCVATTTSTVTQPAVLSIGKTITNVSCFGGNNGSVALTVSGGTPPYTYLWNNGQTTATATGLAAGTYTTTVTDNKGCTATTTSSVTQPAILSIGKTITNISCFGGNNGSVALSVTGGTTPYTYLWSNGQTTATATTLVAGTYTATVTDSRGCTAITSSSVTQPAALSIGKTITNVSCPSGNNGSVALSVTGGTTPYTYLWSNGQTSATATNLIAGTYTATVTDNKGCVATTTASVTQPGTLSISKIIGEVSCPGGANGSVALTVSGGAPPYSYLWNNGQTTATATGLAAGTYTTTITSTNGCTATTTSTVTQPAVFAFGKTITNVSCFGGNNGSVALSVTGGTTPYTYAWNTGQTAATATNLIAGTYTTTVTDSRGCTAISSSTVTQPAVLSIGKIIMNVSCPNGSNGSVALSVTGGTTPYTYLWNNGQTTATATVLTAGTYTATVTDNKGCVATTTASVTQPTPFSISRTTTNVSCSGGANGSVVLSVTGATPPYTYLWSSGQTTATISGLVAGTYTASVTDSRGCVGQTIASVTQPAALAITKTITNVSTPGGSDGSVALSVTGGTTPYTYLWNNGQTTATATGLAAGIYTATVTDNKGCTATTSATVTQPTGGTPTLLAVSANTIRIKYYNAIAPATATAANLPIWGDETGQRTGTYSVSADTVTFVANTAFRVGELIHITSKSSLQFTGGGATTPFSWVRQSVVTNPTAAVFDTTGTGIVLPSAAYSASASYNATMADVNRDGLQDLVFRYHASYGAATNILVYLRNTDGTFAAPATYTNAESHSGLVGTPDVNNDGYSDIVLFHNFPSAIHVRLNNGSGSFGAATLYSVSNYCNGAKVYDMDNDGDLDIIAFSGISTLSSNTISVLKNNGNGTFAAQVTTNTGVFGTTCQPADLDNDGDMDLAYTSSNAFGSSRVFRVYRNDGTGALTLNNSEANNLSKQVMSAFDYTADGNVDLITLVPNGEIYLGNTGINYSLATPTAFTTDYAHTFPGDLDGDGDLDIFNANSSNGTNWNSLPLKFFRNNGSGTFTTTTTALILPIIGTTDLSDYDSDGDLDHIYLNPATGEIKVLLNGNLPICTNLATPAPGATNVPVTAALSWPAVNLVTGYRLSIGTTPGGTQILNNFDVGNVTTYDPPGDLPYSATIYVTVTPYNTAGNATGCTEESFETEVSLLLTTGGIPAATLVTDHLIGGGCFEVSNITSAGVAASRGTFSGGTPNINIASGVVLCTGNVSVLTGPNNANNASGNTAGFSLNSTDDPDLATISAGNQFDVSRIEFDFKPTTSSIQFEFVFGSEEYCEYVSSQFNDVFGIFISGPGINGTQNIALVPNTNTPVTINNVNALVNPAYYVNNNNWPGTNCSGLPMAAPEECQLDGWTGVLTATATVVPCATYHIKLAIADIADGLFASAVFIRMNTLTNSGYANATAVYPAGQGHLVEGCSDGFVKFTRAGGDLNTPLPVPFSIGGTATPNTDYEQLSGTATIPAGATEVFVPVNTYADLLSEMPETITVTLDAPCSCATATTTVHIHDKPPLVIDMDDQVQCGVPGITLTPDILSAGLPPLTYTWSTGATTASIAITTPGTSIFTVTVTDDCGSTATAAASVTLTPLPNNFSIVQTITPVACPGGANGAVALNVSGGTAPYTYLWNNGQMAATATSLVANTYTVTLTDSQGCSTTVSATVTQPVALSMSKTIANVSCPNAGNGAVALSVTGGTAPYTYLWNNGQTTATATGLIAGTYTVTLTDSQGCSTTTTAMVTQPATNPPPADLCQNACVFCTINGYEGSTAGYTGQAPPGFCGTAENEQWMGFVAEAASLTITATPADCQNGNGVQLALYTGCNGSLVACNLGQNSGGNTPVSITVNVTPGETYFLLVDGWAGDICNFTLQVTPAPTPAPVQAAVKAFLQGPYVSSVQLMHDSLRVKNLIPLTEPYTGLTSFTHTGGGGGEQTTAAVRAVTGPNAIVDWVFLELRNPDTPAQVVATRSALVQRDGDVVDVDGVSPVAFGAPADRDYYLTVRHRNHLGVQLGAELPFAGCLSTEKDFTLLPPEGFYAHNGLSPAQRLISGRYALWAGNGRIDPQLKYNGSNNDRNAILSVVGLATPNAVVPGYRLQDYNMDGVVKYNGSANDRNVLLGNVGIATPSAIVEEQVAR